MPPTRTQKQRRPLVSEGLVLSVLLLVVAVTVPLVFRSSSTSSSSTPTLLTRTTTATPSAASTTPDSTQAAQRPAPLVQAFHVVAPIAVAAVRILFGLLSLLAAPFAAAARGVLVLLQPLIFVLDATFNAFVLTPWRAVSAVAAFLYPLYTFAGCAVLLGLVAGLTARGAGRALSSFVTGPKEAPSTRQRVRRKKLS